MHRMDAPLLDRHTDRPSTIAEVAVDGAHGAGGGTLSYAVPDRWRGGIGTGQLVWVPLRKGLALGIVIRLHGDAPGFALKPLHAPVEPAFRLDDDRLAVAAWLARETATSLFAAAAPFLPPGVTHRAVEHLRLREPEEDAPDAGAVPDDLTPAQGRLVALLTERGEVSLTAAQAALGSSLKTVVAKLEARGVVERVARVTHREPNPALERFVRLVATPDAAVEAPRKAPKQSAVVEFLVQRARLASLDGDGFVPLADVLARTGTDHATVAALARKGLLEEVQMPRLLPGRDAPGAGPTPTLTAAQAAAWVEVERALVARDPTPLLLHGVTGSGKTEVYLRAVAWCLRHGRAAVILVPEIGLAAQVVRRFRARFPGQVAVLHSALKDAERYATWQGVAAGRYRVVVGPRSALFAPVEDLGLIVLDEEHEGAYKQDAEPRYHARALAEFLAAQQGATVVLGSATPAVESFWRAETGEARLLELPHRVGPDLGDRDGDRNRGALGLPEVEVVDLRLELHRGNHSLFSKQLADLLRKTLAAKEQTILFLNRRGLATVVLCKTCGTSLTCPFCDIPLVYHGDRGRLLCHRCNHREPPPRGCGRCGGALNYFGAGTQRVEEEVKRLLPDARVLRWDQDSVRKLGGHETMLRRVERREVDVVVGTQMIAKGLDLPLVTGIGVIHADTMLHLPDFRAGERTFQLLTQVAGRAGRRAPGSRVIVQSYTPAHYAIAAAAKHDYAGFYAEEIDFRRAHDYPPFTRLVRYLVRDADEARCAAEADEMARLLARHAKTRGVPMDLLGPTPAFASKVRGKFQWQIVLRTKDLEALLDGLPSRPGWSVDVDPMSLL
ncbi:MAG: Helicase PriA essential for oriC/DnaA-independent DNA replication [uncultured Thermomicrobiales bacterium]|uniref:Replication restart protein PriA n=1 Tax=uncultured Thermomicrobiales bacterium TaxID=1645740 RepID=A0A6J4UWM7_9BACT|nr:MAG: Helicase PriA essential for oriC/DnaA-independent DNA replication [uncultured Thermomicrobiales bacterium]